MDSFVVMTLLTPHVNIHIQLYTDTLNQDTVTIKPYFLINITCEKVNCTWCPHVLSVRIQRRKSPFILNPTSQLIKSCMLIYSQHIVICESNLLKREYLQPLLSRDWTLFFDIITSDGVLRGCDKGYKTLTSCLTQTHNRSHGYLRLFHNIHFMLTF